MAQIWRKFSKWPAPWGVALLLIAALASPAAAQNTYTVSTSAELVAAVQVVNTGAGGDLIALTDHTFSLTAPLAITRDVTIQGDPLGHSVIEGDGLTNILVLRANNVSLLNFTIRNGLSAIYWVGSSVPSATGLTVTGMTITQNRDGVDANEGEGQISITNSTIANNTGSGVQVMCPAPLQMTNVTVSHNKTGVKFLFPCSNLMQFTNTLIVENTTADCGNHLFGFTPDGAASIDSDGTCASRGFPGMATLSSADVDLRSLANNGGPTWTQALAPTSAAINAGTSTGCPTTDQRGALRNDGFCDIGAYEAGAAAPGRNYFVWTPDQLAAAIFDAKNRAGRDRIFLAGTVFPINSSTIHSVRLSVDDNGGPNDITLTGAGAAFTILEGGGPTDRNAVVYIDGSSLITIEKMTIQNGGADGIYNNGNLVLHDVIVRNHARAGIESVGSGLAISGSTISGNGAALDGACCEAAIYVESTFSAVNTTIADNQTTGMFVASTGGGASMVNVTIDGNAGAGLEVVHGPITITNTIVADNAAGDCASSPSGATSGGNNLIGDASCGFGVGDINGVSPQLGPLQDNGGPTPTMELLVGSPAIDAGGSGACPPSDQRGISRPQGAACDIGAFELVPMLVNGAPTCVDYTGSTYSGGPPAGAVSCSDPDAGDTFTVAPLSGPSNGVLALYSDGSFTYLPNSGFVGTDSFTFQATDSHNEVSNVATATITVINQLPTCPDYTGSVTQGDTLNQSVGCADLDAGDILTVSLLSGASSGTLIFRADGTFTFTPANFILGTVGFTYQATDSHGAVSAVGTATITVASRPPVCNNFNGSVLSGVTLAVGTVANILCSDPDGDTFTYSVVTAPAHGIAFISFMGTGFEYASSRTYIGNDSFTYRATDGHGAVSNIATATIQIVDTAPTCQNFTASVAPGGFVALLPQLGQSCSDLDPFDFLTYAVVTGPTHGTVVTAGGFAYLPSSTSYFGPDSFTYQATDSRGVVSNVGTATIQIVNTGTGFNVYVPADPSVSLSFNHILTAGSTTAVSSTTGPPSPVGFQIPGGSLYWEISTTATYGPAIDVCILPPTGVINPRLLHYQSGAWVDVTTGPITGPAGTFICGRVTSLSPFVVAVKVPPSADVATQLQQLQAMVESFNLRKAVAKRFIHRLDQVQDAWADTRDHKKVTKKFCEALDKFMRDVQKATGKTLTAAEAAQLLALSQLIASEIGCRS